MFKRKPDPVPPRPSWNASSSDRPDLPAAREFHRPLYIVAFSLFIYA